MPKTINFELIELILLSVSLIQIHITRFVKLPKSNKNTMLHYDIMFCLHELCHSHMKKNVLLKFLRQEIGWGVKTNLFRIAS